MAKRLFLIKFRFTLIVLSLPTYILAIQQPFLKRIHQGKGRNKMWPWVNKSFITLKLKLCRKKQLNLGRISLLKRKAQHKRKRIQRKKDAKIKETESPVHRARLFYAVLWNLLRTITWKSGGSNHWNPVHIGHQIGW